jgi:hypothetical protein
MGFLMGAPPKPPPLPVMKPVENTALTAKLQAANRRMGAAATMLSTPGSGQAGAGPQTTGANTLTGA